MVDSCLLFDADTATDIIHMVRPDVYAKGSDYSNDTLPEAKTVEDVGGRVVILPFVGSTRTSSALERIYQQHEINM